MIYHLCAWMVGVAMRAYYRKIHLLGLEKIPKDRPLLIACNHPTGFLEPCIKAAFFKRELHFLTRGDLFKKPLMNFFLRSTHQIPVFRFRDGFDSLKKNQNNFTTINDVLAKKGALVVYIEGSTSMDRALRPFQKGLARMTKDALTNEASANIAILPIAVNFSDSNLFRSSVSMEVFDIIEPTDYNLLEPKQTAREIKRLTKDVYEAVLPGIFHLDNNELDQKYNSFLDKFLYDRMPNFYPVVDQDRTMQNRGKRLTSVIETCSDDTNLEERHWEVNISWIDKLSYYLLAPIAFLGYVINFVPNRMARNFAKKKVKKEGFVAPIIVAMNVAYYIGYLFLILILGIAVSPWFLLMILLLPLLGRIYLFHFDLREKFRLSKFRDGLNESELKSINIVNQKL